jgi:hypothetical protein
MEFRIADSFTDSLSRLTREEQKAVKTTAFDLQMNPVSPGMQMHRIERSKDKNFWSVRAGSDIRLIVHKTGGSLLLCYADHHDGAYLWAERRKLETHPKTGAAQFVEVRERVEEAPAGEYVAAASSTAPAPTPKPLLFAERPDDELLGYGVPTEWLSDVRKANEDTLLDLADHLPGEAAEALLELATGGKPKSSASPTPGADPFSHPDAQRRFRIMGDVEELERALEYPWEKWTVFLHPAQRQIVEREYPGPARVSGSAGTGKTIVALHRAVFLARANPDSRVLLASFSDTLANALRTKLRRLISNEPRLGERLEVHAMDAIGERLYEQQFGRPKLADRKTIRKIIADAAATQPDSKFALPFLLSEWLELVDAWQLDSWEAYRDVKRLGRKTRLSEAKRQALWSIFDAVRKRLDADGLMTRAGMFSKLAVHLAGRKKPPFEFAIIDEAQDINVAQLKFLAALGGNRSNGLFFAGDLGQRIFQQPFSWLFLGVDIRGRARTLHINYRTSHQIRMQADRLLGEEVADVDGNTESRRGTVSVFNGPSPIIQTFDKEADEIAAVGAWLAERMKDGVAPHEIGIFVRSDEQLARARDAATRASLPFKVLDENVETTSGQAAVSTMHLAKGLEFRAVAVMACDDEVIPLQSRIESAAEDSDLEEIYSTERHLLYVAITRARDRLLVTGVLPASEFLDDLSRD